MPSSHRADGLSAGVPQNLLLAIDANRSVLAEHAPGQPRRLACCPYGSLPGRSRLAFNGEFREPQGWYHLGQGHRLYNPALRRFNRPDRLSPFGKGGINPYAYCLGDPVNFSDPTGRVPGKTFLTFLSPALYDNPGGSLLLTFSLLALNLVTAFANPPATIAAQAAYYSGVAGAVVGMTGASMQIAGEKEAGRWVSIVGTILSGVSVATKVGAGLNTIRLDWRKYVVNWKDRALGVVAPWKYKPPAPVAIPASASPTPTGTPILTRSPHASRAIPMENLPSPSSSGGSPGAAMSRTSITSVEVRQSSLRGTTEDMDQITYL